MTVTTTGSSILRYDLTLRREDWDQVNNEQNYIGLQVMPAAPVAKASSSFTRLPIGTTMTPPRDLSRNPRASYKRDEFGWITDNYQTQEHGLEGAVDDAEIEMYGDYLPVEQITVQRVGSELLAEHEQAVSSATFNSGAYTGNQTISLTVGTNSFQDVTVSTPVAVINRAKWQCRKYGIRANALVIPQIGLDWLMLTQQIIDRVKYSGHDDPKNITVGMLKQLFNLEHIFVGDGFKNASPDGATPSIARFWDPTMCWVGRVADQNSMLTSPSVCVGRTVMFAEQNAQIPAVGETSGEPAIIFEEYREEARRGGVMRGRWNWQVKPFDDPMADGNFYRAGVLITGITDGTII